MGPRREARARLPMGRQTALFPARPPGAFMLYKQLKRKSSFFSRRLPWYGALALAGRNAAPPGRKSGGPSHLFPPSNLL
jgi:hypothetical protein